MFKTFLKDYSAFTKLSSSNVALTYTNSFEAYLLQNETVEKLQSGLYGKDEDNLNNLLNDYAGKLYSIEPKYSTYFKYVNPMCRIGAFYLGLDRNSNDSEEDIRYKQLDGVNITDIIGLGMIMEIMKEIIMVMKTEEQLILDLLKLLML